MLLVEILQHWLFLIADLEAPKCNDDVAPETGETLEQVGETPPDHNCSYASNSSAPTSDKTKKSRLNT